MEVTSLTLAMMMIAFFAGTLSTRTHTMQFCNYGFETYSVVVPARKDGPIYVAVSASSAFATSEELVASGGRFTIVNASGARIEVRLDMATGLVCEPSWMSQVSDGAFSWAPRQVFRSKRPWRLDSWTTLLSVPWMCWIGLLGSLVLALLAVLIAVKVSKSYGSGYGSSASLLSSTSSSPTVVFERY
jgi:hypothetical protein